MRGRRRLLCPICVVALAATAAGCGTAASRDEARAAAQRLYQAARAGDGATACAQMSPDLRAQLVKDESASSCAAAVGKLTLHGTRVSAVDVDATSARVVFAGGDSVFLGEGREGWRVDALGCHPHGPGPYECEAQA